MDHTLKHIFFLLTERTPYHDILLEDLRNSGNKIEIYYLRMPNQIRPWEFDPSTNSAQYCSTYHQLFSIFITNLIKYKPDIVIIAGYSNFKFIFSYLIMKAFNIPFSFWGDIPRQDIKRPFIKRNVRGLILKWIFANARHVLVMGAPGIEIFKALGCPVTKLRELPYTVDTDLPLNLDDQTEKQATALKRRYAPQGEILFLCAGRLAPIKAYDVALKAVAKVLPQHPDHKPVLLIAGDGPQRQELQELAINLGISRQIHFLGWTQPQEMNQLFYAADAFIQPSEFEPFGVAVLEAMSWGLPVLASDRTMAALDRVKPGESGFIHHVGNFEELAHHLKYLLEDRSRIDRMGAKARLAAEQWPVSRCVQTILDLL